MTTAGCDLAKEFVPHLVDGDDVARLTRIVDPLPKFRDVVVDRARDGIVCKPPNTIQQFVPRHSLASTLDQVVE